MPTSFDAQRLEQLRTWADQLVMERKVPGLGLLIFQDGQERLAHFSGWRRVKEGQAFDRDTLARIYSMTKPITSAAIMQFVERGHLTLATPLDQILPAFRSMNSLKPNAKSIDEVEPSRPPTIHELLLHTAGFSSGFNEGLVAREMAKKRLSFAPKSGGLEGLIDKLAELPLVFQPGTRWEYGSSIDVAGRVVEVISGQSLEDYFQAQIFGPLGMDDTSFTVSSDRLHRFADLYAAMATNDFAVDTPADGGGIQRVERAERSHHRHTETFSGGMGLIGTIDDYMLFVEALRCRGQGKQSVILAPRTVDFMLQNHLQGDISDFGPESFSEEPMSGVGFGLGGAIVTSPARMQTPGNVGDFSWGGMASTFFWIDRQLDLSVVFFTQLMPSNAHGLRPRLKALVHSALS